MNLRTSFYDCQVALKVQIGDFYFINGTVLRLGNRQNSSSIDEADEFYADGEKHCQRL